MLRRTLEIDWFRRLWRSIPAKIQCCILHSTFRILSYICFLTSEFTLSRPHSCKKSFHRNVSGGGLGQLSPPILLGGWPADEKYNLKSWMYNANLRVKYVKSNVESKNLIGKCSTLNAKTWKCNPLNLNVNLNIAYEMVNVQGKNLNVARGKLNDESVNSDVKKQM